MASRLNPYLSVDGDAREAMEFYREVFGGELAVSTFGEFDPDAANADKVMHAMLETPAGFALMGADVMPGQSVTRGQDISVSLFGDDAAELRGYWDGLCDGGDVTMPLEQQVWGDEFGMCVDRYGIAWMVNIAGQPA